jgi:predicted 2-oxoglutarate/Fe(II)-dependent dioxygenase YbiX
MSGRWALPPLTTGDFAPDFSLPSRQNPNYHFSTVAGRYILLGFMPSDPSRRAAALTAFEAIRPRFDALFLAAIFVVDGQDGPDIPADQIPSQRWLFDRGGEVARRYHLQPDEGRWFLLDPMQRLMQAAPIEAPEALFARIASGLPPLSAHAGTPLVAPALIVPRVFEPEFCRRLIDIYESRGGAPSGVMRDIDGRTVGVLDDMKRRRDVNLEEDLELRGEILQRISRSVIPMIARTYQFRPTRIERYLVACYDAAEGGYFKPHRDNESRGTAHRRFACSINLNAEEFEGGDLRFPEFGRRTYRPPTGGAVVFACNMLHEATPVTRGRRYAFLPFFYDEEGQRIREANLAFLESAPAEAG